MRRPHGDEGTITILVVGFTAILLLLIAVVVDVSAVVLARRGAASAADGAAVAAAQQLDQARVYATGIDTEIPLSYDDVAAVVQQYAADVREGQPGLTLEPSLDQAGTTATVVARRDVTLPFVGWLGVDKTVTVTAVARARAPVVTP